MIQPSGRPSSSTATQSTLLAGHHRARVARSTPTASTVGPGSSSAADTGISDETLQPAVGAEELEHEIGSPGAASTSTGGAVLLEHAADVEHGHAVAEADRLVDVVGHEHDRLVQPALQLEQLVLQAQAHDRIDRAERLVHQQHRRIGGERTGDADALLLTARQLGRVARRELGLEADEIHQLLDPLVRTRALSQPSSSGTVAMLRAIVRCGNSPTCWIT